MTTPDSAHEMHLDPDLLADLAEGLLDVSPADAAHAHLASCALCAGDYSLISGHAEVSWDSIEPEPIPADVFASVAAALDREPSLKPASHPSAARGVRTVRGRRFQNALKALAAGTAVVVGGYVGISALSGAGTSNSKANSGSASAPKAASGQAYANGGAADSGSADILALQNQASKVLAASPTAGGSTGGGTKPSQFALRATGCWEPIHPAAQLVSSTPYAFQGGDAVMLIFEAPGTTTADVVLVSTGCPVTVLAQTTVVVP